MPSTVRPVAVLIAAAIEPPATRQQANDRPNRTVTKGEMTKIVAAAGKQMKRDPAVLRQIEELVRHAYVEHTEGAWKHSNYMAHVEGAYCITFEAIPVVNQFLAKHGSAVRAAVKWSKSNSALKETLERLAQLHGNRDLIFDYRAKDGANRLQPSDLPSD